MRGARAYEKREAVHGVKAKGASQGAPAGDTEILARRG